VPQSVVSPSPNARPGAGYNVPGADTLQDPDWIPEVGALDQTLREATSIAQIVDHLTAKYQNRDWDFSEFQTSNFTGDPVDLEAAREAAQAFDDMMTKYPFLTFESDPPGGTVKPLRAKYAPGAPSSQTQSKQTSNAFAMPNGEKNPATGSYIRDPLRPTRALSVGAEYVSMNQPIATKKGRNANFEYLRAGKRDSETRDYNLDAMNRPTYYTMIHEMGHVMDFNGRSNSHAIINQYFQDQFDASDKAKELLPLTPSQRTARRPGLYKEWLSKELVSAYSYKNSDRSKGQYTPETIAEAFLDVEARGANANRHSIAIHAIVVEEAKKVKGVA
jgi:hypothetical protein